MSSDRGRAWHGWLALFFIVAGARLTAVSYAGSDLPTWDQWFSGFGQLLSPMVKGEFTTLRFSAPHNEHRVLYSKLMTTSVMTATGRWEPRDELVLSAFVRALSGVVVYAILSQGQSLFVRRIFFLLLAGVWSLPVGVFNLMSGFQAQFFLAEMFSVAALALLCAAPPTVERLSLGMCILLASSLNMASAAITGAAAAVTLFVRGVRSDQRGMFWSAAGSTGLLSFVIFWTSPKLEGLGPRAFDDAWRIFSQLASWPLDRSELLVAWTFLPSILLLNRLLRGGGREWSWFIFALSIIGVAQNAAIAFARAYVAAQIGFSQYEDSLWFANVAGLLALIEAFRPESGEPSLAVRRVWLILAVSFGTVLLADAWVRGLPSLTAIRVAARQEEATLSRALETGDFESIREKSQLVTAQLNGGDYRFFVSPAGRFVVPERYLVELEASRALFLPRMPARLVGAPRSTLSEGLEQVASRGPFLFGLGVVVLFWSVRARAHENAKEKGAA